MKRITCMLLLLGSYYVHACDVCGASGSQGLGILPQFYKHFAGVQYQYRSFNSTHPGVFENMPSVKSEERYHTVQLWGKANITDRIQVFAFVPYMQNTQRDSTLREYKGVGDATMVGTYTIVHTPDTADTRLKHILLAGGGIKAPTGKRTATGTEGLLNMQTGTGSWDFSLNANYTLRDGKAGMNVDASYTFTTANAQQYKYGNKLGISVSAFRWWQVNNFLLQPHIGGRIDYALHDYDNYSRKWLNKNTGGYIAYLHAGFQAYYKRIGLQCTYSVPVQQHYAAGYVTALQKAETGLIYLF